MSDIFAPLAAGTPRSAGAGAGETAVRVIDPSPEFSRIPTGENLRGTVLGKDDHGHLLVNTRLGVLHLAAHRNLPPGTEVVLQVRSVGPQVMLNLLTLDAAGGAAPLTPGQTQAGPAAAPAMPQVPVTPQDLVQRSQVLRAVLHAAPPVPLLGGLPSAKPGADLLVQVLSLGIKAAPGASLPNGPTGAGQTAPAQTAPAQSLPGSSLPGAVAGANPTTPAAPGFGQGRVPQSGAAPLPGQSHILPNGQAGTLPAGANATTPGAILPATTTTEAPSATGLRLAPQTPVINSGHSLATALQSVSAEVAARAAGGLTGPAGAAAGTASTNLATDPAAAMQSLRLTGLVTGATNTGQPILHTALGTVTLDVKAALPAGSSLALQITLPTAPDGAVAQALASAWPDLGGLEESLFQGLPALQSEAVARALPQVGPRLASGVLFLLSALNQGNPLGWFAPAAAAAEREPMTEVFERLGREFFTLNRSIETAAGEWRFVNLPLWSDQGLRELRCFFRHQDNGGGSGDGDGEKVTRFVLELDLQRHGELQLDGLVRVKRFDLMLRSRRPLPALVRGDLIALFEEANAIAGYTGQLVFQASKDWLQLLSARSDTARQEGLEI